MCKQWQCVSTAFHATFLKGYHGGSLSEKEVTCFKD